MAEKQGPLVKRFLIVSGVIFAASVAMYGAGGALVGRAFTRADPYPNFMTGFLAEVSHSAEGSHSYEEAGRKFSEFVIETFPMGSDAKNAISQLTRGGFKVTASSSNSVELLWKRHAGPCNELYSMIVTQNANGTIAKITGRLHPICL